jgi:hypothetical protein
MDWTPRLPLTAAEKHVDYPRNNDHIDQRRATVERMALPTVKRLAYMTVEFHGLELRGIKQQLAQVLTRHLEATARFGFQEAQREIRALRNESGGSGSLRKSTAKLKQPPKRGRRGQPITDAGRYGKYARQGLDGINDLIVIRAQNTADEVAKVAAAYSLYESEPELKIAAAADAAARVLHNHVLELVGESLNNGRTAGALSLSSPPEFAMRSAQLDKTSCEACEGLHGEIAEVDSSEFYSLMPPAGCYGGGRCRCVYVFADGVSDVRQPGFEEAA